MRSFGGSGGGSSFGIPRAPYPLPRAPRYPPVFVDSSIVGVLLEAKRLAERGAEYIVVLGRTTGEPVRRMFELTGLGGMLPVVERDASAPET